MLYPKAIVAVVNTHFNFAFFILNIKGQKHNSKSRRGSVSDLTALLILF
jgi:hypothetical protein